MNTLQRRLASLRRRLFLVIIWRGLAVLFAIALGGALFSGLADWFLPLPGVVRALLLTSTLAGCGYLGYHFFLAPLLAKADDLTLVLRVEDHYPILNDALASTVQFLEQGPGADLGDSPSLKRETVQHALRLAEGCNFNAIVDGKGVLLSSTAALGVGTLALVLFLMFPGLAHTALIRFLDPFGGHSWTRLDLGQIPQRVALGQPFVIRGKLTGIIPSQAKIELQYTGSEDSDEFNEQDKKMVPVKADVETQEGNLEAPLDMTQHRGKFRFRVWANDAVSPGPRSWHEVQVVPPPKLVGLPQVELRYPAYTDLPPEKFPPGSLHVEAVAGTEVTFRGLADRAIKKAWIDYRPENRMARLVLSLAPIGFRHPLDQFALLAGANAVCQPIPARLGADQRNFSVVFMPWVSGNYVLSLEDQEGLIRPYEWPLRVQIDPIPGLTLEKPASSQSVLPDAEITLKVLAVDDKYAVRSVYVEYRRRGPDGVWIDPEPRRLPLFHHREMAKNLGQAAAAAGGLPVPDGLFRLRWKRVEISRRWSLKGLAQEGETIVLQVCADDFNDVIPFNPAGRSHEIELRVVGRENLAKVLDEGMAKIQQELVRLQQMQQEAIANVKKFQEQKDKNDPRAKQLLIEAQQKQRDLQARVGQSKEEGLQADIEKLKQMLKDNKLPPSDIRDRLQTLGLELERLLQEDLQQIEPKLEEARKNLVPEKSPPAGKDQKNPDPKKGVDQKDKSNPLKEAEKHQANSQKALDDLVKFMDPWASMHQVKETARKILEKQRDLKKITQKLQEKMKEGKFDEEFQKELEKASLAQNDLAEQVDNLKKLMEQMAKKRAADGDKGAAKMLKEAKDIIDQELLPSKMRDAKDLLEKKDFLQPSPKLHEVEKKQQESIDTLKRVLGALEERRDDQLAKLMKKQRDQEDKLQELRERQDLLQKKVRQEKEDLDKLTKRKNEIENLLNNNKGDPEKLKAEAKEIENKLKENKRRLDRLAEEQRRLAQEARKKARELAHLQAEDASKALDQAGQQMEDAAKQLEDGQNPDQAQDQAMEKLDNAQKKLEEAQKELAREQLARIADRLKGLKERQDAAIDEAGRLHKESIEKQKHWTESLLRSLKNLAKVQKTLAHDAEGLKEKLKGARVFEHIMDRSAKAMDEAANSLENRFAKGNLRLDKLEKEEIADEVQSQDEILRRQKEASRRLQRLLDSLKNEPVARKPRPKKQEAKKGENGKEPEGGIQPADNIPDIAQLKLLRDEQKDINERTKEFAKRFPTWPALDDDQKQRLAAIQAEFDNIQNDQAVIQRLFEEITRPAAKKGENP